jgi:hypothetical protein
VRKNESGLKRAGLSRWNDILTVNHPIHLVRLQLDAQQRPSRRQMSPAFAVIVDALRYRA